MNVHQVEARRWFVQAQADLEIVNLLQSAGYYAAACFHAQQAAEKALKAVLFGQGSRVVWGHSVRELALRVREALRQEGIEVDIRPDYGYKGVRSYRVSAHKIEQVLGVRPKVTIEESVVDMVDKIRRYGYSDFDNPKYYNIRWMRLLEEAHQVIRVTGSVFEA